MAYIISYSINFLDVYLSSYFNFKLSETNLNVNLGQQRAFHTFFVVVVFKNFRQASQRWNKKSISNVLNLSPGEISLWLISVAHALRKEMAQVMNDDI